MPTNRLTVTADLVRTMQREGMILLLTARRSWLLLVYAVLVGAFVCGAVAGYRAGIHTFGLPLGAAFVAVAYPITSAHAARRLAGRLLRPYDVGGGVESEVSATGLLLRDPDTGYQVEYRTRRVRSRGRTALVEVDVGARRGVVLVPRALLEPSGITASTHAR